MLPTKVLYLIMKEAIPDSIENYRKDYEARLKTQKFIYLFNQIWGEDSYNHSWYLAGPYSSTLTHQIYDKLLILLEEHKENWDALSLSDDAKLTIKQVRDLISDVQTIEPKLSESSSYELVASIWYIATKKKTIEAIEKELLLHKPHFKPISNLRKIIEFVTETMVRNEQ